MPITEKLDTHQKALALNLDRSKFGSFAEIGAGQEVARWFLTVGGASGTVAKTISAYDKEVSDDLYGHGARYVSGERLEAMVSSEWTQLLKQVQQTRGSRTRFFSFVNTVSARNFAGTNEPHGWVGLRFQAEPEGLPNDIVLHVNMRDPSNLLEQEALGILGVNLIYAAFHQAQSKESFLESLAQDLQNRIEVDYVDLRGPAFKAWDRRALLVQIVQGGLAEAIYFAAVGSPVPPNEVLYKKAAVLAPGYFGHTDTAHEKIHEGLLSSAIHQFHREFGEAAQRPIGFFCLPATAFASGQAVPEPSGILSRVDALHSHNGDVLLFREPELYAMTAFVNRYTKKPVRFAVGLSLLMRAFEDRYRKLDGSFLEALSRLFAQNVRIYAHPMRSKDLQETMQSLAATGWEWEETNGWVSAAQLRPPAPLAHLYAYLLDSNFLISMPVPAALTADA